MVKEEIWSIALPRVSAFFRKQEDVTEEDTNTFTFRSCRIRLTELPPRGEGIWAVKRIRLHMKGDDADVENIYHRYFMQFLSAGG